MSSFVVSEQSDHFELSNDKYSHQIIGILDRFCKQKQVNCRDNFLAGTLLQ